MLLTVAIIGLSIFIVHRFIVPMVWATILTMVSFPLYQRWLRICQNQRNLAAFTFTTLITVLLLLPLSWLVRLAITEVQYLVSFIAIANTKGQTAPHWLIDIPGLGPLIGSYWQKYLGVPGGIKELLASLHLNLSTPTGYYLKKWGVSLLHRGIQFGFTIPCLFFFFRDGEKLVEQIEHLGEYCLGARWSRYATQLPQALRATVNGTIVVGIGVGLIMGFLYAWCQFPAPALTGFITAVAAMIPFVVPVVFGIVALILFANGGLWAALLIVISGTVVMFIADHFVKPVLIGGATRLPFLAVLFGILGGVETLGILGLFIGPIIMVFFMTLWSEPRRVDEALSGNQ